MSLWMGTASVLSRFSESRLGVIRYWLLVSEIKIRANRQVDSGVGAFSLLDRFMNNLFLKRVNSCIRVRKERTEIYSLNQIVASRKAIVCNE
jgi:hypothetical protein